MKVKPILAEFLGTFALIFIGAGAAAQNTGLVAVALAHGFTVIAMIYIFGPISGTHINPAVTLALALIRKIKWEIAAFYWIAQLLGGVTAAALLVYFLGDITSGATVYTNLSPLQALAIEALLTFFLVTTVLFVAVEQQGKDLAGVIIGLTLIGLIFVGGPLTGASLNPTRTLGPALFTGTINFFPIYLLGPLVGGGVAAVFYTLMKER